jgi:transcriptional regulator with XRE-family HTH domain
MIELARILGANVSRRRMQLGLSLRGVADKGGLSVAGANRAEKHGNVTLLVLERVAVGLDCTAADLLTPPKCITCFDAPPPGFTCNQCGTSQDEDLPTETGP